MTRTDHRIISIEAIRSNLEAGREVRLHINGNSMSPWLIQGDVVIVREVRPVQSMLGDILVICRGEDLVTHRLVAIDANGWYTKGDSLSQIDPPVPAKAILGRVDAVERNGSIQDLHNTRLKNIHRMIGWLSLQEGLAHRRYEGLKGDRPAGKFWVGTILSTPFRLPIWLLAVFRR